jgi:hypothetical protein
MAHNQMLKNFLNMSPNAMSCLFIDILSILKKYPPAKNENKFIYGKVCEARIIKWIHKVLPCTDLDNLLEYGSEYKNDCEITFGETKTKYSIKVSKSGGEPTLINKRNKRDNHSVLGSNFIICHIEKERLYIFEHTAELDEFIKDSHESIKYKPSIFKYLDSYPRYYYDFPKNEKLEIFKRDKLQNIEEVKIYERLASELESEMNEFY